MLIKLFCNTQVENMDYASFHNCLVSHWPGDSDCVYWHVHFIVHLVRIERGVFGE